MAVHHVTFVNTDKLENLYESKKRLYNSNTLGYLYSRNTGNLLLEQSPNKRTMNYFFKEPVIEKRNKRRNAIMGGIKRDAFNRFQPSKEEIIEFKKMLNNTNLDIL